MRENRDKPEQEGQWDRDGLLALIAPLKPGLKLLEEYRLLEVHTELARARILLPFKSDSGTRFDIVLRQRHESVDWELRTAHFHLSRLPAGAELPESTAKAMKLVAALIRRNEVDGGRSFADQLAAADREQDGKKEAARGVGGKIYLRTTEACQLDCIFCSAAEGLDSSFQGEDEVYRALAGKDLSQVSQVAFSGGEPTLDDKLPAYVRRAVELGAKLVVIQTNGIRLAEAGYLARYAGFEDRLGFGFSIHAASETTNRLVTGRAGVFDKQWRGLERCLEYGFGLHLAFVVTKPALGEGTAFVEMLAERAAGHPKYAGMYFAYPSFNGNAYVNRHQMPELGEYIQSTMPAFERAVELGLDIHFNEPGSPPRCVFHKYGYGEQLEKLLTFSDIAEVNPREREKLEGCRLCR